jgi:hypothetical protein
MESHVTAVAIPDAPIKNKAGRRHGGLAPKGARSAINRTDSHATFAPLKGASAVRGVPHWVARDAAARGEFPIAKFGRVIYVKWRDFDAWIDRQLERRSA